MLGRWTYSYFYAPIVGVVYFRLNLLVFVFVELIQSTLRFAAYKGSLSRNSYIKEQEHLWATMDLGAMLNPNQCILLSYYNLGLQLERSGHTLLCKEWFERAHVFACENEKDFVAASYIHDALDRISLKNRHNRPLPFPSRSKSEKESNKRLNQLYSSDPFSTVAVSYTHLTLPTSDLV